MSFLSVLAQILGARVPCVTWEGWGILCRMAPSRERRQGPSREG